MSVRPESITALVGPNGAGKSTLIRACVGFEVPDQGRVLVVGVDPTRDRAKAVSLVGYVPQTPSLYRNMTIVDHLDMARVGRPSFDRSYAAHHLKSLGLSAERRVAELSVGEQAQVALAVALGTRAPLLLLDEPLANLDPLARRDFLAIVVDDVRARGATAVLSSHVVTDIEQACDHLVVLAGGRLVLSESVTSAKRRHRTVAAEKLGQIPDVGTFSGASGDRVSLVLDTQAGRAATLEEIVLGYLASARKDRPRAC